MAGFDAGFTGEPFVGTPGPPPPPPPPPPVEQTAQNARPIVEIGFTVGPFAAGQYLHLDDPVRGRLDSARLAPDDVWTDVTAWLHTFSTQAGVTRVEGPILRYEAGSATVALNNSDRRFDPTNMSGPYVAGGVTQVEPMRAIRVRAQHGSIAYTLWQGFIDSWMIENPSPDYSRVTVTCTDGQKVLGNYNRVALGTAVGAGELSGARVNRILNSVGWPAEDRIIDTGVSAMQATTLDGDAWTELLLVQDSEIGEVYLDGAGRVVFRDRHAVLEDTRSTTSQATFGSQPGELHYESVTPEYDDTTIRNVWRIARTGGTQQTAADAASQLRYLTWTHDRTDLLLTLDSDSLGYAQYGLYLSKDPELRFAAITVDPRADPVGLFPQTLGRGFGDRITIVSRPPGGGTVTRDVFIRGVSHTYGGANRWKTTWALQSATKFQFLILDDATYGKLDEARLAF